MVHTEAIVTSIKNDQNDLDTAERIINEKIAGRSLGGDRRRKKTLDSMKGINRGLWDEAMGQTEVMRIACACLNV